MKNLPSLRRLQMFEQLGRTLNFHRTAVAAGIAQPALSRGIRQLEDELGFDLFQRTTRSTQLTPAGQVLHLRVQQWLEEMEVSFKECRQLAQGASPRKLVLGYSAQASYGSMSQRLFRFGLHNADVALTLRLISSEAAYEEIEAGTLDGAFVLHDTGTLARHGLESVPVEEQRVVVLCAASHPLARRRKSIGLKELGKWGIAIGSESRWGIFRSKVLPALAKKQVQLRVVYEADDTPLLIEAVAHSEHLALFGDGIANHLPGGVVALTLDERIDLPVCFAFQPAGDEEVMALTRFLGQGHAPAAAPDVRS